MLVKGVTFTSVKPQVTRNYDTRYWHGMPRANPISVEKHAAGIGLGVLVATAVCGISLLNIKIRGKYYVPQAVIELADKSKGLNKIKEYSSTVNELKNKVLYRLLATQKGYKVFKNSKQLKSGLILGGENTAEINRVFDALKEHADQIGFKVKTNPFDAAKQRAQARKWVHNAFKEAQESHKLNGEYTFIDVGDIDTLTAMKANKSVFSAIEKLLYAEGSEYEGVFWFGKCAKTKELPYFYNDAPVLITKLMK